MKIHFELLADALRKKQRTNKELWTETRLAMEVDKTESSIRNILAGRQDPSYRTAQRLALVLNVPFSKLEVKEVEQ